MPKKNKQKKTKKNNKKKTTNKQTNKKKTCIQLQNLYICFIINLKVTIDLSFLN